MKADLTVLAGALALVGAVSVATAADTVPQPDTPEAVVIQPDTTGPAMWAHIQEENYQESWDLWPGKGEFYQGGQPHGMLLTTYVNDVALNALNAGETTMPDGAIIIKENYTPDRDLAAVTVMSKSDGYNADHNDWFFAKYMPDGSLDTAPNGMKMAGRVPGCQSCHQGVANNDYLFTERPQQ